MGIPRSSYYYKPRAESELNLELMRMIDEQYTKTPFYGIPRMTAFLRSKGYRVNHKKVERLMGIMGIQAIYPKKKCSISDISHRTYPYLIKGSYYIICRPSMVLRYNIYQDKKRFCISYGYYGLVFQICNFMEAFHEH